MASIYYAQYDTRNGNLYKAQCECLSDFIENIKIKKSVYDNLEQYMYSDGEIVKNPEYPTIYLNEQKEKKIEENDTIRDEALIAGVTYKDVLFDSDTDQKANLMAIYQTMGDEDKITWFGKDNQALECSKEDIANIGALIAQLHTFIWNKNAEIKEAIANAEDLETLDTIELDYTMTSET